MGCVQMGALTPLGFIGMPGSTEMIIVLIIAVLLFGKRLPEVGRSLGRGIIEFKKGIRGIEDEIESATREPTKGSYYDDRQDSGQPTAPDFEPPSSEPQAQTDKQ
jgi:sec-independent protein translocase protein TatA